MNTDLIKAIEKWAPPQYTHQRQQYYQKLKQSCGSEYRYRKSLNTILQAQLLWDKEISSREQIAEEEVERLKDEFIKRLRMKENVRVAEKSIRKAIKYTKGKLSRYKHVTADDFEKLARKHSGNTEAIYKELNRKKTGRKKQPLKDIVLWTLFGLFRCDLRMGTDETYIWMVETTEYFLGHSFKSRTIAQKVDSIRKRIERLKSDNGFVQKMQERSRSPQKTVFPKEEIIDF